MLFCVTILGDPVMDEVVFLLRPRPDSHEPLVSAGLLEVVMNVKVGVRIIKDQSALEQSKKSACNRLNIVNWAKQSQA
jgi:hypothetical protein